MALLLDTVFQKQKELLFAEVVVHADFLRIYRSPERKALNQSVVVRLANADHLGCV